MKYYLETVAGEQIVSNLEEVCKKCLDKCKTIGTINYDCGLDAIPKRNGIQVNRKGKGFLCCGETKTTKLFREKLANIVYAIPDFLEIRNSLVKEIASTEHQRFKRVVHNLKSLNAHNIQELYNLVPQELLTVNINDQLSTIKGVIVNNLDQTALTFIRVAKHNSHMKAEFAIQDKIFNDNPQLSIRLHPIRKVLMNVLHTFFVDFEEKDVLVSVGENYTKVNIDYESIHVALYHIIENASKYIKPRSVFNIRFSETYTELSLSFEMDSLNIQPQEVDKILTEGYSGINAHKARKAGEGIGMSRVCRLIELNNALFTVIAGKKIARFNNLDYSRNIFAIDFKL